MDEKLGKLIQDVCNGFPTQDVVVSNTFDVHRFAFVVHYAWTHKIGFHPDMFKEALKKAKVFSCLSDGELEDKARTLCHQGISLRRYSMQRLIWKNCLLQEAIDIHDF